MKRQRVNKARSAQEFRRKAGTTKARNLAPPPARGGIRL